jgi:signal transduction histidine kinase
VCALIVLAVGAEWAALARTALESPVTAADVRAATADLIAGLALGASGILSWQCRSANRTGPLLMAAGVAWFLGTLADSGVGWLAAVGGAFVTLHRGPLMHALVAYPSGRIGTRFGRAAVAAAWISGLIAPLGETGLVTALVCALVLAAIVQRLTAAAARERVAVWRSLAVAAGCSAALVGGVIAHALGAGDSAERTLLVAYELVIAVGVPWLAAGIVRPRWTEAAVANLVIQLGRGGEGSLERRVADVVGDPSLRIGYRVPGGLGFVDTNGDGLSVAPGTGREVTYLGGDEPVGVLVHDPGALQDPTLLEPVAAAVRIAVANVQLRAAVREHLAELAASRRRIVEAADREQRRFESDLRSGPVAKLAEVQRALDACSPDQESDAFVLALAEARGELDHAEQELGEFARGVRPPLLTEGGLDAALTDLAQRAAVPVELAACRRRFAPAVEAAAYFVCAEGLANVGKYAGASAVSVGVSERAGTLVVTVSDNGVGGARIGSGSGLIGLSDRVGALGGTLNVSSPRGGGTRLEAALPLG